MAKTVKISISMPASEFKALEAGRRKAGRTRSQYIRDILAAYGATFTGSGGKGGAVREDRSLYGSPLPADLTDKAELRRRAISAAGRFESGLSDLSIGHDRYLTDMPDQEKSSSECRKKKERTP
ncbi:MAG: ribbon-helix-helix protein, CopG family [Acidobacteriota bacterium]|nr:ribbon-helix-helix protein, CopG family [Acidobacteriota bacterium]